MVKKVLRVENAYECRCIGLVSSSKDYRICHFMDKLCGLSFLYTGDVKIPSSKRGKNLIIPRYRSQSEQRVAIYYLVGNKSNTESFIPALKSMDYLLLIEGEILDSEYNLLKEQLKKISVIEHFVEFDPSVIKGKEHYIFENHTEN